MGPSKTDLFYIDLLATLLDIVYCYFYFDPCLLIH